MNKMRYSKDVDILLVKVSDEPVDYAEEMGQFIVHFSKDGKPALLEIQDAKDFVLESLHTLSLRQRPRCLDKVCQSESAIHT